MSGNAREPALTNALADPERTNKDFKLIWLGCGTDDNAINGGRALDKPSRTRASTTNGSSRRGGGNENEEWTRQGGANVVLDDLIADKKIEPMIVVFPNSNATAGPAADGRGGASGGRAGLGGGFGGWGMPFENDLLKDIIPFIESHY